MILLPDTDLPKAIDPAAVVVIFEFDPALIIPKANDPLAFVDISDVETSDVTPPTIDPNTLAPTFTEPPVVVANTNELCADAPTLIFPAPLIFPITEHVFDPADNVRSEFNPVIEHKAFDD